MATRIPPSDQPDSGVAYYEWRWGSDEQRRPGLPWIGIFLVVFGGLLLLEQALPQYRGLGNIVILAAGIASLIAWAIRRGTISLYAGAFLTALAAPGTYEAATGTDLGPGWGTFWSIRGGGWGWQLMWGSILALLGAVEILQPDISGIALPLIIVAIGVLLLLGSRNRATS
jgi:hypothetical protein